MVVVVFLEGDGAASRWFPGSRSDPDSSTPVCRGGAVLSRPAAVKKCHFLTSSAEEPREGGCPMLSGSLPPVRKSLSTDREEDKTTVLA